MTVTRAPLANSKTGKSGDRLKIMANEGASCPWRGNGEGRKSCTSGFRAANDLERGREKERLENYANSQLEDEISPNSSTLRYAHRLITTVHTPTNNAKEIPRCATPSLREFYNATVVTWLDFNTEGTWFGNKRGRVQPGSLRET